MAVIFCTLAVHVQTFLAALTRATLWRDASKILVKKIEEVPRIVVTDMEVLDGRAKEKKKEQGLQRPMIPAYDTKMLHPVPPYKTKTKTKTKNAKKKPRKNSISADEWKKAADKKGRPKPTSKSVDLLNAAHESPAQVRAQLREPELETGKDMGEEERRQAEADYWMEILLGKKDGGDALVKMATRGKPRRPTTRRRG